MIAISDVSLDGNFLMIQCTNGHTVRIRIAEASYRFESDRARKTQEAWYDRFNGAIVFYGYTHLLACLLTWSVKGVIKPEQLAKAA